MTDCGGVTRMMICRDYLPQQKGCSESSRLLRTAPRPGPAKLPSTQSTEVHTGKYRYPRHVLHLLIDATRSFDYLGTSTNMVSIPPFKLPFAKIETPCRFGLTVAGVG